ncbi:MAG: FGGY-family carbohydrate kinase [Oscillospiraceae bacterium]|nr:FGGY-family carbohydrate kinase [Oscillospiraceae bacterium]
MSSPLVITFDVGTQSARAVLVDAQGTILHKAQLRYEKPYYSKYPDWAEQRPDFYWEAVCTCAKELREKAGGRWGDIAAVTVTTIRDTALCLDENGAPLRDVIIWLDKRRTKCSVPLSPLKRALYTAVGMIDTVDLQRETSACNWVLENEPEIWEKTRWFVLLSTYLNFRLCGKVIDADAGAIGHIPFDNRARKWMKKSDLTRCVFEMDDSKLYELVKPETVMGAVTAAAAAATGLAEGLPLIATGSDKGCETLGLSVIGPDKAAVSFGTTATIQLATDHYVEPQPFLPPYCAVVDGLWNPEIQVYRGYWLVSWFKREFAEKEVRQAESLGCSAEELLNKRLSDVPPGCDGLILQPYFTPGVSMPHAKGAIIGFSDVHTRIHIYRAIIEGINFSLYEGMRMMEKRAHTEIRELYLGGGGSQSAEICQITADMFGLPVVRTATHEACGIGSAMVAFRALGCFKDYKEAVAAMVHVRDRFEPDMKKHAIYQDIYENIFTKIFGKLLPLYRLAGEKEKKEHAASV